jgi:signal transduction histidine kinase/CheY-like chemotaxis protein
VSIHSANCVGNHVFLSGFPDVLTRYHSISSRYIGFSDNKKVKKRLTLMSALALCSITTPATAESLQLPGVNLNHLNLNLPPVSRALQNLPNAAPSLPPVNPHVNPHVMPMINTPTTVSPSASMPSISPPSVLLPNAATQRSFAAPQLFNPINVQLPKPTFVTPAAGDVQVEKGAQVLVSRDSGKTRIQNLTGIGKSVRVQVTDANGNQKTITLDPGTELVTGKEPLTEQDVRIGDGIPRRNISVNGNIAVAEFDLASVLKGNGELRRLVVNPATKAERALGKRLLKTAASLITIRGRDGFEQAPPIVPPAEAPSVVASGQSPATTQQTEQSAVIAAQQQNQAANLNTTTVAANPRATNTFDQTHPLLPSNFRGARERAGPRRLAQLPPTAATAVPNVGLPVLPFGEAQHRTSTGATKVNSAASAGHELARAGSAAQERSHPLFPGLHKQLQQSVREHPNLAIALIALFAIMFSIMAALAYGFYKSRHEVNRLNRGLQAKVAELNELNDELTRTRDKALEASRLKSEFVANISHEIRTPITAVLGMIGLLKETQRDEHEFELVKMLDDSARSLLNVINDILDFSKIEAGMLMIHDVDFQLADVAKEIIAVLSGSAKEKKIDLLLNIDPAADIVVHGDPFRLRQVLTNLLSNAIKFTQEGAVKLTVKTEENGMVGFYVKDTGIGISPESRKRLFQPFSQADGTTTRRYGGTGLGLSISKRLVELMGGQIDFRSESGSGSEFWFTVPLGKAQFDAAPASEPVKPEVRVNPAGPLRILVAEDSPVLQRIVTHQLKSLNYDVVLAKNGLEALEAIKSGHFDLVLMDWQMPELDGIQATEEIRKLAEGATVPIIAMTANAMEGDRLACLNAGMNDYISKPFTLEQLQKAIEAWMPVKSE